MIETYRILLYSVTFDYVFHQARISIVNVRFMSAIRVRTFNSVMIFMPPYPFWLYCAFSIKLEFRNNEIRIIQMIIATDLKNMLH